MAQALAAAGFESLGDLGCAEDWWRSTDTSNMEFQESGIVSCLLTAVTEGTLPKATHKKRQAPEQTDLESVIQVVSSKAPRTVCPCGPAARARELACEFSTFDEAAQWASEARISAIVGSVRIASQRQKWISVLVRVSHQHAEA